MDGRARLAGYLLLILAGAVGIVVSASALPAAAILVAVVLAAAGVLLAVLGPAPPPGLLPDRTRTMLVLGACSGGLIVAGLVFWAPLWQAGLFVALGAAIGSMRRRARR